MRPYNHNEGDAGLDSFNLNNNEGVEVSLEKPQIKADSTAQAILRTASPSPQARLATPYPVAQAQPAAHSPFVIYRPGPNEYASLSGLFSMSPMPAPTVPSAHAPDAQAAPTQF